MRDSGDSAVGAIVFLLFFIALPIFLAMSNPTQTEMLQKVQRDGWVPVGFERTNLVLFSWVQVNGFTGAKATFVGIGGGIFKMPWSDD